MSIQLNNNEFKKFIKWIFNPIVLKKYNSKLNIVFFCSAVLGESVRVGKYHNHSFFPRLDKVNIIFEHFVNHNIIVSPDITVFRPVDMIVNIIIKVFANYVIDLDTTSNVSQLKLKRLNILKKCINEKDEINYDKLTKIEKNYGKIFKTTINNLNKILLMTFEKYDKKRKYFETFNSRCWNDDDETIMLDILLKCIDVKQDN